MTRLTPTLARCREPLPGCHTHREGLLHSGRFFWIERAIVRVAVVMLLDRWQRYGRAGLAIRTAPCSAAMGPGCD